MWRVLPTAFLLVCTVALLALAAPALAASEHVVDPALSLTGGTGTTTLDPVPDPGPGHPKKSFNDPCGVTTDAYGNVYVANGAATSLSDGVIDVFSPTGEFITEIPDPQWPCAVAVDSSGRLYAYEHQTSFAVRYDPLVYEPDIGNIEYDPEPTVIASAPPGTPNLAAIGLDPSEDHLYVSYQFFEAKFRFDELLFDGTIIDTFTENVFADPVSLAVWGENHDVYSTGSELQPVYDPFVGRVYALDGTTHEVKMMLDGSNTPEGDFGFTFGRAGLAVDQANGDIYVDAIATHHLVDQFDSAGNYIGKIELEDNGLKAAEPFSAIAVDQGEHSPNQGYVYVTSGFNAANAHVYAFAPRELKPPEVRDLHLESAGETEAVVAAEVNPHGDATTYRFEYGTADCSSNPCQSAPVPPGQTGAGGSFQSVLASLTGLQPGTTYHVRLVATNHCDPGEPEGECAVESPDMTFATFPAVPAEACPNAAFRIGPSAGLPDCRAYELVTPADTNGRIPTGAPFGTNIGTAPVLLTRGDGESVVFGTEGGSLPGSGGSGFYDTYRAVRSADGWHTALIGLNGIQAGESYPGGVSADHSHSLSLVVKQISELPPGQYLRGAGGTVEPVGIGGLSPGKPVEAQGRWVSPGAAHLVFTASEPLEPGAPPSGTRAVYDRTPGGPTHLVSLLPGEASPAAGEGAEYLGAAADGSAIAFRVAGAIYVRIDGARTVKATDGPATFGGLAADGSRVFYVKGGDIFAFHAATETTTQIGSGGQSTMVNVSADGSHVYFVSPVVLSGKANSEGAKALAGAENLYVWSADPGSLRFVARVEEEDVVGEAPPAGGSSANIGGLGLWASDAVEPEQDRFRGLANDPSRTTPDGDVFVFESRAQLTGYDNDGHSEIYRYDDVAGELACVSCNPTLAPAASDARLESRYAPLLISLPPVNAVSQIANVAAGGEVVFFQSGDRLAVGDLDDEVDVYEWEAEGRGGCELERGCVRLISGGRSGTEDYLYGASADGSSVFFLSSDSLLPEDADSTPSIYAARTGGGFPSPPAPPSACVGEACQPAAGPPAESAPLSSSFSGPGNRRAAKRRCPKGRRRVRTKDGRNRCVKRHVRRAAHRHGGQQG